MWDDVAGKASMIIEISMSYYRLYSLKSSWEQVLVLKV